MSEAKHTPGPWGWYGSTQNPARCYLATLHGGRVFVMGFKRVGTQGAEPTFQFNHRMVPASELAKYDVGDGAAVGHTQAKEDKSVYRYDFSEIDHPDARLIAAAPDLLSTLSHIEVREPDDDGLVWLYIQAGAGQRSAMFNLGPPDRIAAKAALEWKAERDAALAKAGGGAP